MIDGLSREYSEIKNKNRGIFIYLDLSKHWMKTLSPVKEVDGVVLGALVGVGVHGGLAMVDPSHSLLPSFQIRDAASHSICLSLSPQSLNPNFLVLLRKRHTALKSVATRSRLHASTPSIPFYRVVG